MPNRKERRKKAAMQRKQKPSEFEKPSEITFAERLQLNVQQAILASVPPELRSDEKFPRAEAIRSLGMMAAVFAIQGSVSREDFASGMADYYDGIMRGLGSGTDKGAEEPGKGNGSGGFRF